MGGGYDWIWRFRIECVLFYNVVRTMILGKVLLGVF